MKKLNIYILLPALLVLVVGVYVFLKPGAVPVERFGGLLDGGGVGKPNVLFITLDTTRADRLGCYGNEDVETPVLDRLAGEGVLFRRCISPTPLTLPSHSSMMTGLLPTFHGVRINGNNALSASHRTLAELFSGIGYRCGAFVASFVLDGRWGLKQGFEHYDDRFDLHKYEQLDFAKVQRRGDEIVDSALGWMEKQKDRPFFAWVHFYDPHFPYEPPEPYFSRYKDRGPNGLYDGEIAYTDEQVGRCLDFLEKNNLTKNTIVVVMGDHGEGLGEHGEATHGYYIYDYAVHVPFIIKTPFKELRGIDVGAQVRTIDIFSTLLEMARVPVPAGGQGESLLPLMFEPRAALVDAYAYGESLAPELQCGWSPLYSLQTLKYKYIHAPKPELYDLNKDPLERNNLIRRLPGVAEKYKTRLDRLREESGKGAPEPESADLDRETLRRLSSLGYIGTLGTKKKGKGASGLADPKDRFEVYKKISMANDYIGEGDYATAVELLEPALKDDPGNPQVLLLLSTCYMETDRPLEAKERLESLLKNHPEDIRALMRMAELLSEEGKPGDVEALCKKALSVDASNTMANMLMGKVYMDANRFDDALRYLRKVVEIQPKLTQGRLNLASCHISLKQYDEAETMLTRIRRESPSFAMVHFHLGLLYEETNRPGESRESYLQELRRDPALVPARFNYGRLLYKMGDLDGYLEQMRAVVAHDPTSARGYLFLARGLLKKDSDLDAVLKHVQKGISLAKDNRMKALGHYLLADIYTRKKQPAKVQAALKKARALSS